jgi:hypothetical protein
MAKSGGKSLKPKVDFKLTLTKLRVLPTPTVSVAKGRYPGMMSGNRQVSGKYRVSIPAVLMSSGRYSGITWVTNVQSLGLWVVASRGVHPKNF